ncbi:hypothetical protein [Schaalia odontolytica]
MSLWQWILCVVNLLDPLLPLLQAVIALIAVIVAVSALRQNEKMRIKSEKSEMLGRWFGQAYPVSDCMYVLEEIGDESALQELKIQGLKAETGLVEVMIRSRDFGRVGFNKFSAATVLQKLYKLHIAVTMNRYGEALGSGEESSLTDLMKVIVENVFDPVIQLEVSPSSNELGDLRECLANIQDHLGIIETSSVDEILGELSSDQKRLQVLVRQTWCMYVSWLYNRLADRI